MFTWSAEVNGITPGDPFCGSKRPRFLETDWVLGRLVECSVALVSSRHVVPFHESWIRPGLFEVGFGVIRSTINRIDE